MHIPSVTFSQKEPGKKMEDTMASANCRHIEPGIVNAICVCYDFSLGQNRIGFSFQILSKTKPNFSKKIKIIIQQRKSCCSRENARSDWESVSLPWKDFWLINLRLHCVIAATFNSKQKDETKEEIHSLQKLYLAYIFLKENFYEFLFRSNSPPINLGN